MDSLRPEKRLLRHILAGIQGLCHRHRACGPWARAESPNGVLRADYGFDDGEPLHVFERLTRFFEAVLARDEVAPAEAGVVAGHQLQRAVDVVNPGAASLDCQG